MIHRLYFSVNIKADKTKIWEALWNDKLYRDWVAVFSEGSYMVVDNWNEGSSVLFLDPDKSGIYSLIEKHIPCEIISFKHIGTVLKGQEQPMDDEVKKWSGANETYSLTEENNSNKLSVVIDILDEHLDFMKNKFPEALERIKNNCS